MTYSHVFMAGTMNLLLLILAVMPLTTVRDRFSYSSAKSVGIQLHLTESKGVDDKRKNMQREARTFTSRVYTSTKHGKLGMKAQSVSGTRQVHASYSETLQTGAPHIRVFFVTRLMPRCTRYHKLQRIFETLLDLVET